MPSMLRDSTEIEQEALNYDKRKKKKKICLALLEVLFILLVIGYLMSLMYTRFGSFTVSVNKYQQLKYGLTLSETKDFRTATSMLNCKASHIITNIDGSILDNYDLGAVDGIDNGDNYMCYTFYCKNAGLEEVSYEYSIVIAQATLGIDKAVRVRLITTTNGVMSQVDYARAASVDDQGNPVPEPNTTPFYTKTTVCQEVIHQFKPDDVTKFTVVIWLEGPDAECVDDILGGEFKIDMKFTIVGTSGAETGDN